MNKFKFLILLIILTLVILPVFAKDKENTDSFFEEKESNNEQVLKDDKEQLTDEDEDLNKYYYNAYRKRVVNRWRRGPKAEHAKIKAKGDRFTEKSKAQFETRVQNELYLLRDEYKALDYMP